MEHASVPVMIQDPTMLGSEQIRKTRQPRLQRASSMEKRDEMAVASKPRGAVRSSWLGWGSSLSVFWCTVEVLHASVMPVVFFCIIPMCLGYRKSKWILKVIFL